MSSSLRSSSDLQQYLDQRGLQWSDCHLPKPEVFDQVFTFRLPRYYADLIEWTNPTDPLKLMAVPTAAETNLKAYELADPIGDHNREVVPGLIHRYPDRCLLLLTSYCLIHCRFCFRKEVVGKVRPVQFERIVSYLQQHPEIKEIIFSGGDPLTFPVGFLQSMITYLQPLSAITTWRWHSRVPAIDPATISSEWLNTLDQLNNKKLVLAIHINHPREITPQFKQLCQQLLDHRVLLLSQTVLLKGVNNSPAVLGELFRALVESGVKPYYLHHLDQAKGTHHFRVSIAEGWQLFRQLRGNVSSVCLPEYVLDLPGGHGKVPISWLNTSDQRRYTVTTFAGTKVVYDDPAYLT